MTESDELRLSQTGLRFTHPPTEASYRDWHIGKAVRFTREGMIGSLVAWGENGDHHANDSARLKVGEAAVWIDYPLYMISETAVDDILADAR